ncbi:zinc finger protein [Daphnia sinensis]|uniref:Zinc finger protein n=1 Tax=Daphnia sinensis TaxID=1820382 RepID=A0AAD5L0Q4_9CRUS|nr:zinc finger protein [Daphnia sinensis]
MPPTDGQVVLSAPPTSTNGTSGDSNAAIAANSALSVPFTCNFCQRSFPRLSLLKKHEQAHSDEMPFRCDFCLRLFKHKRSRDRHVKLHTGDKKYRCQHCEAAFSRSDHLKIHVKTHDTRKPFQCSVCQRGYSTAAALTSHMLNHRRESGSRCGSLCSSSSSVSSVSAASTTCSSATPNHGRSASSNASTPCPTSLPSSSPVSPPPTPTNDAPTVRTMSPSTAIKQHPPPSSVTPPMELPNSPASPPISQYQNQPQTSPEMDKSAIIRPALQLAVSDMASPLSKSDAVVKEDDTVATAKVSPIALQCPYCAKESFSSLAALSLHVQTLHGPLSRRDGQHGGADVGQQGLLYACQLCTLRFGNLPALQQHTLSAHSLADLLQLYCPTPAAKNGPPTEQPDAQNFPTDLSCPKKRNEVEEEIEGRFACPQCPSEFKQSEIEAFQAHVAGHLMSSWNEYGCSSCVKSFTTPDELQKHLLDMHAHHLYRCALCKETFDSKVSIQVHLAVQHSSESKLYRCTGCPASDEASFVFRTEAEFNAHVVVAHTSRIPPVKQQPVALLKCPLCPQSFAVEFLLERHMHLTHQGHRLSLTETPLTAMTSETSIPAKVEQTDKSENNSTTSTVLNLSLNCAYCGETCKSRSELESHMKNAHHPPSSTGPSSSNLLPSPAVNGRIKCNICDEIFPTASVLAEHKLSHCKVSGAAVCAQCRVPLPTEEAYYAHLQAPPHGPSATPPLTCLVCRQTLNLPLEVGLHARFHTAGRSAGPPQPEPSLYPCSFCHRHLESANLIANGMALNGQQTYICKDCLHAHNQMMVHQQTALFPLPQPPPRSYQCIKCQEIFATEAEIQSHVASHLVSEGCLHPCRLCARQFDTPLKLQAHLIEHTFAGCPAFACYLCGCLFTAAVNLQRHMFDQHGGAVGLRPYDCSRCHLKFFFRAELENHLLSHNEPQPADGSTQHPSAMEQDKPTDVPEESRSFNEEEEEELNDEDDNISVTSSSHASEITLSDAQKAANAIPEEISEERNGKDSEMSDSSDSSSLFSSACSSSSSVTRKDQPESSATSPFRCDRCDQSFPCLSNLQGHVRIHTQSRRFTCPEASCGKEFALRRNLHIHMRSHTGDRPYSCPMCPKRFARKENRKAHLKLHSGVKPFSCSICSKTFARKSHLSEHGRTHSSAADHSPSVNSSAKMPVAAAESNGTATENSVDIN